MRTELVEHERAPEIRPMQVGDIEAVYALGSRAPEFSISGSLGGFWTKEQLERWIQNPDDVLLVLIENDEVAGFFLTRFHQETGKADMENLFIREDSRGKGYARMLAMKCLEVLKAKGAVFASFVAGPSNNAIIKLFESLGFQKGDVKLWTDIDLTL